MEQKNNFPVCLVLSSQAASFCLCSDGWLVISSILEVSTFGEAYRLSGYYVFTGDVGLNVASVGCGGLYVQLSTSLKQKQQHW